MTDLEGIANRILDDGDNPKERLVGEILTYKNIGKDRAGKIADAIIEEVVNTRKVLTSDSNDLITRLLQTPKANATMHETGVGCRGEGDFHVHRLIARIAKSGALLDTMQQDDAGAVKAGDKIIVSAVDGTHSRLSDFPFIAGFHVARAALRDVCVKGAKPVALIDDLHLADDGDVGKLFDFVGGVACVAELTGVPLIAGSTLRVGGDMVIGERLVSGVGAIGVADKLLARKDIREGDLIIMTQGSGGGTIATNAIYSGNHGVVEETLNIDFIKACDALQDAGLTRKIHAMIDVTNGGLRGDANEICKSTGLGMEFEEQRLKTLVNPRVLELLEKTKTDYLGVSLDSLMIFTDRKDAGLILQALAKSGIKAAEVGAVTGRKPCLITQNHKIDLRPKYRESAYTPLKRAIGEETPADAAEMAKRVEKAAKESEKKKEQVKKIVNGK